METKIATSSNDAEESVLGCILLDWVSVYVNISYILNNNKTKKCIELKLKELLFFSHNEKKIIEINEIASKEAYNVISEL